MDAEAALDEIRVHLRDQFLAAEGVDAAQLGRELRATILEIEKLPSPERDVLDEIRDDLAAARARRVSDSDVAGPSGVVDGGEG